MSWPNIQIDFSKQQWITNFLLCLDCSMFVLLPVVVVRYSLFQSYLCCSWHFCKCEAASMDHIRYHCLIDGSLLQSKKAFWFLKLLSRENSGIMSMIQTAGLHDSWNDNKKNEFKRLLRSCSVEIDGPTTIHCALKLHSKLVSHDCKTTDRWLTLRSRGGVEKLSLSFDSRQGGV